MKDVLVRPSRICQSLKRVLSRCASSELLGNWPSRILAIILILFLLSLALHWRELYAYVLSWFQPSTEPNLV